MKNAMQTKINTGNGFSAHVDIEDLENLGWELDELYEDVASAMGISFEDAEKWEKENYHIRLVNYGDGIKWISSHNTSGDRGDAQDSGDAEMVENDIQELYAAGLLWEVEQGEDEEE